MNKKIRNYKYARYPMCFGKLRLEGLCDVARKHGMKIIAAYKPPMHVCAEIGLYGTKEAMIETEREWINNGHEIKSSRFGGLMGMNLKCPRKDWVDK